MYAVVVPGDGGSQVEARLNKPSVVHIWCTQMTTEWYSLWLNLELLAPYILDCFIDNIRYYHLFYISNFLIFATLIYLCCFDRGMAGGLVTSLWRNLNVDFVTNKFKLSSLKVSVPYFHR